MLLQRLAVCMLMVVMTAACGSAAQAQNFPNKPVRIVAAGVGGSGDFAARLIAQGLGAGWPQPLIVDNRGDGTIAATIVQKAPADGYTLQLTGSNLWLLQFLRSNVGWDALKEFSPLTLAVSSPNLVVVPPAVAAKSVRELSSRVKAKPGALNYGTSGTGTSNHLAGELFKAMAGVDVVRVNCKGAPLAITDLISGQLQLMFAAVGSVSSHVKTGLLKALAVTSVRPTPLASDLLTVAASVLPGYELVGVLGIFAPAGTPAALVQRFNREIAQVLHKNDVKETFFNTGTEIVASTPEELTATMKSEINRMGKVIKDAGIRDE